MCPVTKKRVLLSLAALLAVLACAAWLALRPRQIGSMEHRSSHPESSASNITFQAQPGDRLRLSFSSRVEGGELSLILYDAAGNPVEDFGTARELRMFLTLDQPGPYRLEAEYRDFVGRFRVVLSAPG